MLSPCSKKRNVKFWDVKLFTKCAFSLLWILTLCPFTFSEESTQAQKGKSYFEAGEWNKALPCYNQAIQENPNDQGSFFMLGKLYFSRGDYFQAMRQFWEVLRLAPDHAGAEAWLGVCFLKRGFPDQAKTHVGRAYDLDTDDWQSLWAMGELSLAQKDFKKAEEFLREALNKNPDHPQVYLSVAEVFQDLGQWDEAEKAIHVASFHGADPLLVDLATARFAFGKKDFKAARDAYLKVLQGNPQNFEARKNLGMTYEILREWNHAIRQYEIYLKDYPDDEDTLNSLGLVFLRKRAYDEALRSFSRASEVNPKNVWVLNNLAIVLRKLNRMDEAIQMHQRAIQLEPMNAALHCNLGNTYFEGKNYLAAVVAYEKGLKVDPPYSRIFRKLGLSYLYLGNLENALLYLKKAQEGNPADLKIMDDLGMTLMKKGDFTGAIEWFRKALEGEAGKSSFYFHLGEALRRLGNFNESLTNFQKALELNPRSAFLCEALGDLNRIHLRNRLEAVVYYQKALLLYKSSVDQERVKRKLDRSRTH
ncbi:MAG: tetratricopeptide repeat protein [Chlamydiae bacterium]|nr:tetratricopeptide repeat protein [Chlamydiota bacterium]